MLKKWPAVTMGVLSAFLAAGCQSLGGSGSAGAAANPELMPKACTGNLMRRYALFGLPPTAPGAQRKANKSQPLQYATSHPVSLTLTAITAWRDLGNGWSTLGLRLASNNAGSLSVHLTDVSLPPEAEVWFCSPDGETMRQGPLRAAGDGQLSTPVVRGSEAVLEVIAPTASVPQTSLTLAEVFGGFR